MDSTIERGETPKTLILYLKNMFNGAWYLFSLPCQTFLFSPPWLEKELLEGKAATLTSYFEGKR